MNESKWESNVGVVGWNNNISNITSKAARQMLLVRHTKRKKIGNEEWARTLWSATVWSSSRTHKFFLLKYSKRNLYWAENFIVRNQNGELYNWANAQEKIAIYLYRARRLRNKAFLLSFIMLDWSAASSKNPIFRAEGRVSSIKNETVYFFSDLPKPQ
jgi:hypothetical protein